MCKELKNKRDNLIYVEIIRRFFVGEMNIKNNKKLILFRYKFLIFYNVIFMRYIDWLLIILNYLICVEVICNVICIDWIKFLL